jgi:hypothetical protein
METDLTGYRCDATTYTARNLNFKKEKVESSPTGPGEPFVRRPRRGYIPSIMGKVTIPLMACAVLCAAASGQGPQRPAAPPIGPAEGVAAIRLARQAMLDYLRNRTPAEAMGLPDSAQSLAQRPNAAAVTLRSGGAEVAQSVRRGSNLSRSVIEAALAAMRSPKLPDQVTAEYLAGLTVEVEVLGPSQGVGAERLGETIVPGLVGVTASRGLDDFTALPSDSYVWSLTPEEVPRECLSGLPLSAANASLPVRWQAFAASHYVGYPDGNVLWFYQGRTPIPAEMIDTKDLSAAAGAAGVFLLRNQDKEGRFALPEGPGDPVDELYATMAMARLAKATGRKDLSGALEAALAHAVRRVRQEAAYAYVSDASDEDQLSALSFLVLAIQEVPPRPEGQELCRKLLATIDKALASQRREETPTTARSKGSLGLKGLALAHLASARAEPNNVKRLEQLRKSIELAPADDAEDACWLIRAGLGGAAAGRAAAAGSQRPAASAETARAGEALDRLWPVRSAPGEGGGATPQAASPEAFDPSGGFARAGRQPDTVVTALSAVNLAAGRTWPGLNLPQSAAEANKARREWVLGARKFCYLMQYRPFEAYFAAKPGLWMGGVRASPGGARITLRACAAAIEALLAE